MVLRFLIAALLVLASSLASAYTTFDEAKDRFERGLAYSYEGRLDEAISEYEASIRLNPYVAEAYNNLGFIHYDKGDFAKAVYYHKKSLEISPLLANGHYGLGLALESIGDLKAALIHWKRYLQLSSDQAWIDRAKAHIQAIERKIGPPAGGGVKADKRRVPGI